MNKEFLVFRARAPRPSEQYDAERSVRRKRYERKFAPSSSRCRSLLQHHSKCHLWTEWIRGVLQRNAWQVSIQLCDEIIDQNVVKPPFLVPQMFGMSQDICYYKKHTATFWCEMHSCTVF